MCRWFPGCRECEEIQYNTRNTIQIHYKYKCNKYSTRNTIQNIAEGTWDRARNVLCVCWRLAERATTKYLKCRKWKWSGVSRNETSKKTNRERIRNALCWLADVWLQRNVFKVRISNEVKVSRTKTAEKSTEKIRERKRRKGFHQTCLGGKMKNKIIVKKKNTKQEKNTKEIRERKKGRDYTRPVKGKEKNAKK